MNKEKQIIKEIKKEKQITKFFNDLHQNCMDNLIPYPFFGRVSYIKDDYRELLDLINRLNKSVIIINDVLVGVLKKVFYIVDYLLRLKDFNNYSFETLNALLIKKNRDYGNSFDKSIKKFGWIYLAIELDKKKNRLHSLLKSKEKPNYESIEDTLLDIAGYCVLALIYIENNKE